jgi:hypothetical protein
VANYEGRPAHEKRNRDVDYQAAGTAVWRGRNAVPEAFWKAVRREARTQYAQGAVDPTEALVRGVIAAANVRFQAFRGNALLNRGAWAGSATHGAQPGDYARTPAATIAAINTKQVRMGGNLGSWWLMQSDTAPSGNALHRGAVDARGDFIYHL